VYYINGEWNAAILARGDGAILDWTLKKKKKKKKKKEKKPRVMSALVIIFECTFNRRMFYKKSLRRNVWV